MILLVLLAIALTGFLGLMMLIVGLVEAPWPILLGILTAGLVLIQVLSTQRFTAQQSTPDPNRSDSQSLESAPKAQGNQDHVYRGVHYAHIPDSSPSNTSSSSPIKGTYRGKPWQQSASTPSNSQPTASELKYRGVKITQDSSSDHSQSRET